MHYLHVRTIDKGQKFSARKRRLACLGGSGAGEQSPFQALAPDTEASSLKSQDLQYRPTPVDEDKSPPGQRSRSIYDVVWGGRWLVKSMLRI